MYMRCSNYSFFEKIQNCGYLIKTKFFYKDARLIRSPIYVRGKKYIDFGKNLTTGRRCRIDVNGIHDKKILVFGNNVNMGDNVRISCVEEIRIGNHVLMGSNILIIDNSHGSYKGERQSSPMIPPNERELFSSPVKIGDNCWIGEYSVIMPGVQIGNGCVIGAGSVVTKNVPDNCIVCGVPAKAIKRWDGDELCWTPMKGDDL